MALEIEKKYRIDKQLSSDLAQKLQHSEAIFLYEVFEENSLYTGGDLEARNSFLRLRKTGENAILTYKERVPSENGFKQQIEYETIISDVAAMEKIIERLGYSRKIVYEKRRSAWIFENVEIVLDELPFGFYMEIEGPAIDILKTENLLDAAELPVEMLGYPGLTLKYGQSINGVCQARFER